MKSMGQRAQGLRLERMRASPMWRDEGFRNIHPVMPGLRDTGGERPTLKDFLFADDGRLPPGPLPALEIGRAHV